MQPDSTLIVFLDYGYYFFSDTGMEFISKGMSFYYLFKMRRNDKYPKSGEDYLMDCVLLGSIN